MKTKAWTMIKDYATQLSFISTRAGWQEITNMQKSIRWSAVPWSINDKNYSVWKRFYTIYKGATDDSRNVWKLHPWTPGTALESDKNELNVSSTPCLMQDNCLGKVQSHWVPFQPCISVIVMQSIYPVTLIFLEDL